MSNDGEVVFEITAILWKVNLDTANSHVQCDLLGEAEKHRFKTRRPGKLMDATSQSNEFFQCSKVIIPVMRIASLGLCPKSIVCSHQT